MSTTTRQDHDKDRAASLWRELEQRKDVQGPYTMVKPASWWPGLWKGVAGWLAALFLLALVCAVLYGFTAITSGAMIVCGVVLLVLSTIVYRRYAGHIAIEQAVLALNLAGQGLLILSMSLFTEWLQGTAQYIVLYVGVVVLEIALYGLIAQRHYRNLLCLAAWISLSFAINILMVGTNNVFSRLPWSLVWLMPVACATLVCFVLTEHQLAASRRYAIIKPAADATLQFALGGAMYITIFSHPFSVNTPVGFRSGDWIAGVLTGAALVYFVLMEGRRLALGKRVCAGLALAAVLFSASLSGAPAVVAGIFVMALGVRRASRLWTGAGLIVAGSGFIWYYGALPWPLSIKAGVLFAVGIGLLGVRRWLLQSHPAKGQL
jgi:hypothetical protein